MSTEMIARDGMRCFGYSIDENGRASCHMEGAYCECRAPSKWEVPHLQLYIREQKSAQSAWGLTPAEQHLLKLAEKRLNAALDDEERCA